MRPGRARRRREGDEVLHLHLGAGRRVAGCSSGVRYGYALKVLGCSILHGVRYFELRHFETLRETVELVQYSTGVCKARSEKANMRIDCPRRDTVWVRSLFYSGGVSAECTRGSTTSKCVYWLLQECVRDTGRQVYAPAATRGCA